MRSNKGGGAEEEVIKGGIIYAPAYGNMKRVTISVLHTWWQEIKMSFGSIIVCINKEFLSWNMHNNNESDNTVLPWAARGRM